MPFLSTVRKLPRLVAGALPLIVAVLLLDAAAPSRAAAARKVIIDTAALRVEQAGDAQILVMPEFVAESDEYRMSGVAGRFDSSAEVFIATGAQDRPATLTRTGEKPFTVSALRLISIAFRDESLRAEGGVRYAGEDVEAASELLIVDRLSQVQELVEELLRSLSDSEIRAIVTDFLSRIGEEDRLVLLRGGVSLQRRDSSLEAEWVLFHEGNADEFISVAAPGRPLRLSVTIEDDEPAGD